MKDALRPPAATRRSRAALTVLALLSPFVASASDTAPGDADYQRSLHLGQEWMYLTRDLPFAAKATHDGRFYYRKTVPGGFSYVIVDPKDQRKRPAFTRHAWRLRWARPPANATSRCGCRSATSNSPTKAAPSRSKSAWPSRGHGVAN